MYYSFQIRGCNIKNKKKIVRFIYKEEFKTNIPNPDNLYLKNIFNNKYFLYIKKLENRNFGD